MGLVCKRLRELNFFSKGSTAIDPSDRRKQILATRLFLLIWTGSLAVLLTYHSAIRVTVHHEVSSPSYEDYVQLEDQRGSNPSFTCPCSRVSIQYEQIFRVTYALHPFCTDPSVMRSMLNFTRSTFFIHDFRVVFPTYVLSFAQLCQLSAHFIDTTISVFNASTYVTDHMIPNQTLTDRTQTIFEEFIKSTSRSFANSIDLISNLTRMNELISSKGNSFSMYPIGSNGNYTIRYFPTTRLVPFNGTSIPCNCFIYGQCFASMSIYLNNQPSAGAVEVPGLFAGCSILEGLMMSSWACFFNQSCLDSLVPYLNLSRLSSADLSGLRRSTPQSTNRELIDHMFVEYWDIEPSHRHFFDQCQPKRCSYDLSQHNSWIVTLTTVISLTGGLTKILQIVSLPLVRALFALHSRFKRHRNPANHTSTTDRSFPSVESVPIVRSVARHGR